MPIRLLADPDLYPPHMLTPIRLLADPDALPPSPPSDLAWLRTCGAAGIEKEGKNCERRRGPEKWDDLWCTTPEVIPFFRAPSAPQVPPSFSRPLHRRYEAARGRPRLSEVVRIHLYAFRIALSTY